MTSPLGAGDGLVRPLNAPSGHQVLPGVQPGVSGQVILAQYVIVFGNSAADGAAPGMFVYRTGSSPGPGNPPIFSISNATQDPYGNPIAPGIWAGPFGGTQAGLQFTGALGQLLFPVAGTAPFEAGGIAGFATGGGAEVQMFSAQDAASGATSDRVFVILGDHASTGSSAAYFLGYIDASGTAWFQALGGAAGLALNSVSQLTAVLPGTGTSSANPAQPEVWHNLTPDAAWTIVDQPQYRLLPGIGVQVSGLITRAGTAAQVNINGSNPVPAAYNPSVTRYYRPPQAADLAGAVQAQNSGVFVMRASGFSATQAILDGIYRL